MKQSIFKSINIFAVVILLTAMALCQPLFAKAKTQKANIKVEGVCGECKERIEEAAYSVEGVRKATWSKKTKQLTIVFNSDKTTIDAIANAIVNVGHDANGVKATDEQYKKLPACCAYRDGAKCSHD